MATRAVPKDKVLYNSSTAENIGVMLQCQICSDFLNNNRECRKCGSMFCFDCLDKWMKEAGCSCCPKCGLDAKELPVGFEAFLFNNFVNRVVNNLEVTCPNNDNGCCEKTIKRCNYWDHVEKECKGRRLKCENCVYGCKFEGNGLQMEKHKAEQCLFEREEIKQLMKRSQIDSEGLVSMNKQLVAENQQSKQNIEVMLRQIDSLNSELAKEKEINLQYQQKLQTMMNQPPPNVVPVSILPPPPPYSVGEFQYNPMPMPSQPLVMPPVQQVITRKFRFYGKTVWTKFQGKGTNSEVPGWEVLIDVDDNPTGDNVRGSNKNSGVQIEKKYSGFIRDGILDITVEWTDGRRAKYYSNNILLAHGSPIKLTFEIVSTGKQGGTTGDCGYNQGLIEQLQ
ncbi:predicted protein [Naegleria gruberi]|uniref:Predicted protein n=1 Tax=Naegleria gruberi TaxID=5762 RepID=D2UZG1_NAEGR|nr:uncharacterized protein NAEGRDRAFT_77917 [Naegleria gruberi]EFC50141.1 predicted protein [Naegleria gruberi]|eukprot:XP_002682885.1 predicted protein [Naegleria gruberi strain NEG-M]